MDPKRLRQRVLRRVRYALNTRALLQNLVPPEGPFDTAVTNGLAEIVATDWPGEEWRGEHARPASGLLDVIEGHGGLVEVDVPTLREGLDLSQAVRHARADDEWDIIGRVHVDALAGLDAHASLDAMTLVADKSYDDALVAFFLEEASSHLPFDLKDRLDSPDIGECDQCDRLTFVQSTWDDFGRGDVGPGFCVACGHERDAEASYWLAAYEEIALRMQEDD